MLASSGPSCQPRPTGNNARATFAARFRKTQQFLEHEVGDPTSIARNRKIQQIAASIRKTIPPCECDAEE